MVLMAHPCATTTARICSSANIWRPALFVHAQLHLTRCAQKMRLCSSSVCSSSNRNSRTGFKTAATADLDTQTKSVVDDQDDWLQRSRLLVGQEGLDKLSAVNILLVGLGGVGSFAAEFLCRAGIGSITIVDGDSIDTTNRNRQLPALKSSVGKLKAEVVAARLRDINPELQLTVMQEFLDPLRAAALVQQQQYHYVIDCIDSVAPKQALLLAGHAAGAHVISSMGAGGRLDPSRVRLADISATYNDAFAAVVRRGLRKAGVASGITVVFSDELARPASLALTEQKYKKSYFGTCSYIPALFGLYIASHVIRHVVDEDYKLPAPAAAGGSSKANSSRKTSKMKNRSSSSSSSNKRGSPGGLNKQLASSAATAPAEVTETSKSSSSSSSSSSSGGSGGSIGRHIQQHPLQEAAQQAADVSTAASGGSAALKSFDQVQGVGMGFDGEGL